MCCHIYIYIYIYIYVCVCVSIFFITWCVAMFLWRSRIIAVSANVFCCLYPTINKVYLILSYHDPLGVGSQRHSVKHYHYISLICIKKIERPYNMSAPFIDNPKGKVDSEHDVLISFLMIAGKLDQCQWNLSLPFLRCRLKTLNMRGPN